MARVLVIKTASAKTVTHYRVSQDYPSVLELEALAKEICAGCETDLRAAGEHNPTGPVECALCEVSLLEVPGTDLEHDISIVDGTVVNAKSG